MNGNVTLWRQTLAQILAGLAQRVGGAPAVREPERVAAIELEMLRRLCGRVDALEQRFLTYYRERFDCIDKLADYLVGAQLSGDYFEFGVFQGTTFSYAMKIMSKLFPAMKFIALDSFEGLPPPRGADALDGFTSGFRAGEFACDQTQFLEHLAGTGADIDRVRVVPGWFDASLHADNPLLAGLDKVAVAWIDCDLYESTVPVLEFLTTRLEIGSVLLFDDWRCFRNLPSHGEQRACAEWLLRNPALSLRPFIDFGFHGTAFTIERC